MFDSIVSNLSLICGILYGNRVFATAKSEWSKAERYVISNCPDCKVSKQAKQYKSNDKKERYSFLLTLLLKSEPANWRSRRESNP